MCPLDQRGRREKSTTQRHGEERHKEHGEAACGHSGSLRKRVKKAASVSHCSQCRGREKGVHNHSI